ncbi:Pycsar system effector family protein [Algoriphagus vanfongensis]|uniref:Pycsar system effector family protein n=1 Tax=Algoriphagus vanfongensis TaxID=426371 RepID=UPI0003FAA370|nr:Pycsar system effector family protein [Algoriphagus vanfongensis]
MDEQLIGKVSKDKTSRERQTFYRVTFNNNSQLLKIADNKANIIISINALVISSMAALIGYGSISNQLDSASLIEHIPLLLFVVFSLASTIFAIQAAKPKIVGKPGQSLDNPSLIFFGSVSYLQKDQYIGLLKKTMDSRDEIMEQMSTSLYYQSLVLNQKYRLLRYAYMAFMAGFIIGAVTFLLKLVA